jgi:hypothetical protein
LVRNLSGDNQYLDSYKNPATRTQLGTHHQSEESKSLHAHRLHRRIHPNRPRNRRLLQNFQLYMGGSQQGNGGLKDVHTSLPLICRMMMMMMMIQKKNQVTQTPIQIMTVGGERSTGRRRRPSDPESPLKRRSLYNSFKDLSKKLRV